MPFDLAGNFTRVQNWQQDRDNGIRILADRHDAEDNNFANAFNQAFLRNGVVPMTGDLNMNGKKIKTIAAGTEAAPGLTFELSTSTGLYQANPNHLGFSINGVKRLEVVDAGAIVNGNLSANGAAGIPLTVTFNSVAAQTTVVNFQRAGVNQMFITAHTDGNTYYTIPTAFSHIFQANGATRFSVHGTGVQVSGTINATGGYAGDLSVGGNIVAGATVGGLASIGVGGANNTLSAISFLLAGSVNNGNIIIRTPNVMNFEVNAYQWMNVLSTITYMTLGAAGAAITGNLSCTGNATLGDATSDVHTINGSVTITAATTLGSPGLSQPTTFNGKMGGSADQNAFIEVLRYSAVNPHAFLNFGAAGVDMQMGQVGTGPSCYFDNIGVSPVSSTTASAANIYQASSLTPLLRSTSALRYKRDVAPVPLPIAHKLLDVRPIQFKSRSEVDDPDKWFYGFVAEEVAKAGLEPLIHYAYQEDQYQQVPFKEDEDNPGEFPYKTVLKKGAVPRPDGVQYERVVVLQQLLINELYERLALLEEKTGFA